MCRRPSALLTRGVILALILLTGALLIKSPILRSVQAHTPSQAQSTRLLLPLIITALPPFDTAAHTFSFENYAGAQYTNLTPAEVRRLFGDGVCAQAVQGNTCVLTPQAQEWMQQTNTAMSAGHSSGMATLSLLFYTGTIKPQSFGAQRTADLTLDNNVALQREIAYWFAANTAYNQVNKRPQTTPNDVVTALRSSFAGQGYAGHVLTYASRDLTMVHAVAPVGLRDLPNGQVAIQVYDSNYPKTMRDLIVDTRANTWTYSPAGAPTEVYSGDAGSNTLWIKSVPSLTSAQRCYFCGAYAVGAPTVQQFGGDPYPPGGTATNTAGGSGLNNDDSSRWQPSPSEPAVKGFTGRVSLSYWLPIDTSHHLMIGTTRPTTEMYAMTYLAPGFTFEIDDLALTVGLTHTLDIGVNSKPITFTSANGDAPTMLVGIETAAADFSFVFHDLELQAGDTVVLEVDTVRRLLHFKAVTAAATGSALFSFEMERIGDTSIEIFDSPDDGVTLEHNQTLLIDYGAWDGNGTPLDMGYDNNQNGALDAGEKFEIEDVGDTFQDQP